jgi:hypothetical protein
MPMRDERKPHDTSRNENADSDHAPAFEQAGRVMTGSDRPRTLLPRRRSAGVRARGRFDMIAQVIGRDNLFFGPVLPAVFRLFISTPNANGERSGSGGFIPAIAAREAMLARRGMNRRHYIFPNLRPGSRSCDYALERNDPPAVPSGVAQRGMGLSWTIS